MAKKDKKAKAKTKKKSPGKMGMKARLFMVVGILVACVLLPTSLLLFIGLLPSIIAVLFSAKGRGPRASTVFAMNVAGCVPFVFKLWAGANDFEASVEIITNMRYLSVIYMAAAFGYMIDWVVTGIVTSYLYQKGILRMKAIKKAQSKLVENWGTKVSGALQEKLDAEDTGV